MIIIWIIYPITFRKPLRTQQFDPSQLNSPDFVGSFSHADHVYFFFREVIDNYILMLS